MSAEKRSVGLVVRDLCKQYQGASGEPVFQGLNFELRLRDRLAILGRNGQGKSTLIKVLGGVLRPTAGTVDWRVRPSWPIGFGGGFQGSLSGIDNIRFISRIYDRNPQDVFEKVEDFAELGSALKRPVKHYSSGMRARLAFGLSLAIEFDCYLVDELVAVGDVRFQKKCNEELFERRADRAFMLASHDMSVIAKVCDRGLIVESGKVKMFDDVEEAIDIYNWLKAS